MSSYRLSNAADADLVAIFLRSLDDFGIRQAERYRDELKAQFERLGEFPDLARLRTEYEPALRVATHKAHVIIYEVDGGDIVIVRVRHGREDWRTDPRGAQTDGDTP